LAKGVVRDVIHRYKYRRAVWVEPFLAGLLVHAARPRLTPAEWDLIVPVPLYPRKEREREFNQAERLGRHLSRATGIPLAGRAMKRLVPTLSQTRLDRAARQENVRNAFAVRSGAPVCGKRIVLVDDVFTTGATTSACSRALRRAGAVRVCVWTVARGN
jgi:ComF family protein